MGDYYNDNDPAACAWMGELMAGCHIPAGRIDNRSIIDVRPDDLAGFRRAHFFAGVGGWAEALRLAEWEGPVWTGSPPCQPFSAAGQRRGRDDDRHLGPAFVELVRACRPLVLFGEQVASAEVVGRASGGAKRGAGGEPAWAWCDDLFVRLEAAGYACGAAVVPACSVGAPHIRQRLFFGAIRMADADTASERMVGCSSEGLGGREAGDTWTGPWRGGGDDRPGQTDGFWRDADWLLCRDGKWRPAKSSAQRVDDGLPRGVVPGGDFVSAAYPLAQGQARRVMRLRGYGNAIVPQAAAAFIRAFCQAMTASGVVA